jgi:hypothetical protein
LSAGCGDAGSPVLSSEVLPCCSSGPNATTFGGRFGSPDGTGVVGLDVLDVAVEPGFGVAQPGAPLLTRASWRSLADAGALPRKRATCVAQP